MVVNKRYISNLREQLLLNISKDMESHILEKFRKEPRPDDNGQIYEYSEQDIFQQIRKMI